MTMHAHDDEHDSQHPIYARLGLNEEEAGILEVAAALLARIEALEAAAGEGTV